METELFKCYMCEELLPLEKFNRDRTRKNGRSNKCAECHRAYQRRETLENPGIGTRRLKARLTPEQLTEFHTARTRRNRARYPRTPKWISKIVRREYPECCNCGSHENLSMDHITPKGRGGSDEWDNLQTLCIPCNSRKGLETIDYRKNPKPAPEDYVARMDQPVLD